MKKVIVPFCIVLVALMDSSCVSKKKFIEMQDGRRRAEAEVNTLTETTRWLSSRIKTMISDFEAMKTELMESNAIKDQYIDSLNGQISRLTGNLAKLDASHAEKEFTLDFDKQRLSNALADRDKQVKQLELKIENIQNDLKSKTAQLEEMNFSNKVTLDKIAFLELDKKNADQTLTDLRGKLEKMNAESEKLKSEIRKRDENIVKLENNVKLLKQELGK